MPDNFFSDLGAAVSDAADNFQTFDPYVNQVRERNVAAREQRKEIKRKDNAFKALQRVYGDAAGDPAAQAQLENTRQTQEFFPTKQRLGEANASGAEFDNKRTALLGLARGAKQIRDQGGDPTAFIQNFASKTGNLLSPEEWNNTISAIQQDPAMLDAYESALADPSGSGVPAGLQTFNALTEQAQGDPSDPAVQAARIKLGLDPRAVAAQVIDVGGVKTLANRTSGTSTPLTTAEEVAANKATIEGAKSTSKQIGKNVANEVNELHDDAQQAVVSLQNLQEAQNLAEQGINAGAFGKQRQFLAQALSLVTGSPIESAVNTDTFVAVTANQVAQNIKAFGAGTGLSDADREFAQKMSGGSIELTAPAIKKILTINERMMRGKIKRYNKRRSTLAERNPDFKELYQEIPVPGESSGQPRVRKFNPATGLLE